jgi:hypothetical protein
MLDELRSEYVTHLEGKEQVRTRSLCHIEDRPIGHN